MSLRAPLEHDEAAYGAKSRQWLKGTPANQTGLQRPPGLPAIGALALSIRDSDGALRIVGLLGGLGAIAALFLLGRTVVGDRPALLAAGAFAASPPVQYRSGQFLNDVPSAALLFLAAAVIWRSFERPHAQRGLLVVAPLFAAAFYLRYASVVTILAISVFALALWRKRLSARTALGPVALFVVLLIPHFIHSVSATGKPWGIMVYAVKFPAHWRLYPGHALIEYTKWLPVQLAGPLAGALIIFGLAWMIGTVSKSKARGNSFHRLWFLAVPALIQIVFLGIANHPEERFLFFPVGLLALAGASRLLEWKPAISPRWIAILVGSALILAAVLVVAKNRGAVRSRTPLAEAAKTVGEMEKDQCTAVSVDGPVVIWYSGCTTYPFSAGTPASGVDYVFVVVPHRYQPLDSRLQGYLASAEYLPAAAVHNDFRSAKVYRLRP